MNLRPPSVEEDGQTAVTTFNWSICTFRALPGGFREKSLFDQRIADRASGGSLRGRTALLQGVIVLFVQNLAVSRRASSGKGFGVASALAGRN
jgi:hypothetical protein